MLSKQKVKYIQSLGQKKSRDREGLFIAEGPKLVSELLEIREVDIHEVYATQEWIDENSGKAAGVTLITITEQELEKISQLSTPNQVLAIANQFPYSAIPDVTSKIVLALEDIRDPGNLGTIIRIADWFGIDMVVCSNESAELYNPKVVQSSMGSIARVRVYYTGLHEWLRTQKDILIYATVLKGQDITTLKKMDKGIILVGNESKGVSPVLLELANVRITIPGKGRAESLNAAVATGIVLSHLLDTRK